MPMNQALISLTSHQTVRNLTIDPGNI